LLRNVPYPEADRLIRIFGTSRQTQSGGHSPGTALHLKNNQTSFSGYAIYNGDALSIGEPGQPVEQAQGMAVAADFFQVMGVQPYLGRAFLPGEDEPGKHRVAVITQRTFVRRYAADPAVVGRTLRINTEPYTIVGVLPAAFDAPLVWGPVEFIIPRTVEATFATSFQGSWIQAVGRLKPGVSLRQAQGELSLIAANLEREHPKENAGVGLRAIEMHRANMDDVSRTILWLMTGISLTMLLIACANLASLQVARAFGRSREFAVRAALGGTRRQLMAPLLTESVVLAIAGGMGGLLVAFWSNKILGTFLRINGEPGFNIPIDGRVLAFAAFASFLSALAFGLAPSWIASRAPAAEALKEGSRGSTGSRSHQRLKNSLIVCELALALALVGLAASFGVGAKSFFQRQVGWDIDGLFSGDLALPYNQYEDATKNRTFQRALLDRLHQIPGVEHAVLARNLPLYSLGETLPLTIEGLPPEERGREPTAEVGIVSVEYFSALRIALKQGALFASSLTEKDPAVAVINESFAKRFWPTEDPIGRRVRIGDSEDWIQIIGVVADVKMMARLDAPSTRLQIYRPIIQSTTRYFGITLRSQVPPETLTSSVRAAVAAIDPDLPVARPGSVRAAFEDNLANINMVIVNLSVSAGMGLLIAGVGLFGVISQLTMQRTRDIGVRMALGAQGADIMRMIIGQGAKLLVIGIVVGIPAFFLLTTVVRRSMPEMQLPGPWLLGANLGVLAATTLLACYLPARRATQINPVEALRSE
jgi:predicted permease